MNRKYKSGSKTPITDYGFYQLKNETIKGLTHDCLLDIPLSGTCPINLELIKELWNEDSEISQYHDEYRLCQNDLGADNFTRTSLKVTISENDAQVIIFTLGLSQEKSEVFKNGSTWRK